MPSWDDGKHTKVKKVHITYGSNAINSIEVQYDNNGNNIPAGRHGGVGNQSDEFTLNPGEYLIAVTGYYNTVNSEDVITSLSFQTSNQRTLGPYGNKTRNYFSVNAPKDNQIVGFKGSSSSVLNSVDTHFGPIVNANLPDGLYGGTGGLDWDDSNEYSGVRKIEIGFDGSVIHSITLEYDQTGSIIPCQRRGGDGGTKIPVIFNYPDEYLVSVSGTYGTTSANSTDVVIKSLALKSNKKDYGPYGDQSGTPFALSSTGKQIIGFRGRSGAYLNAIGAYYGSIPIREGNGSSGSSGSAAEKLDAQGGKGGKQWDDGADHDAVRKIEVGAGADGIQYVKFDYVKGGQSKDGPVHGLKDNAIPYTFEINHPTERLVSVEGYYKTMSGYDSPVIQALRFKTDQGRTSEVFGFEDGTKFALEVKDKKIVGFHGSAEKVLHSLGAYFVPISSTSSSVNKLKAQGGGGGTSWDDGVYDGVKKVYVGQGDSGITFVKFEYDKGGQLVAQDHGKMTLLGAEEFVLDYPDEYITSVEGYYDKILGSDTPFITSLRFRTSKQITSPPFGIEAGTRFVLEDKGGKLVGFHGRVGDVLHSLGAYFAPLSTPLTPAKKLQAQGGDEGSSWDDGAYDGVRKVYIGQGDSSITFVKFEYDKGAQLVTGDDHGQKTLLGTEEFELNYPSEYITSVEGYYDKILGSNAPMITSLRFKTNQRTSPPFGIEAGTQFVLEEKGYKIVGFHGQAGDKLHKFGVHVMPITS